MDLGISGKNAILLASSRGLGKACATALAREGVNMVINGRTAADVEATATELSDAYNVSVTPIVTDATSAEGRTALLDACPESDILLLNGGGPKPTPFEQTGQSDWEQTMHNQLVSPIMMVQSVLDSLRVRHLYS